MLIIQAMKLLAFLTPLMLCMVLPEIANVDAVESSVIATVPLENSGNIAVNPSNGLVYVSDYNSRTVSVIDPTSNTVVATTVPFDYPMSPSRIAVSPTNGLVYVTTDQSFGVSVIDPTTNTVVATIPLDFLPYGVAIATNGFVYVSDYNSGTIYVIDPTTNAIVDSVSVGVVGGAFITLNPASGLLYVSNFGLGTVSVIDPKLTQL